MPICRRWRQCGMTPLPEITTTVVIPVFNGADTIGRALNSISEQSRGVEDIVVVDDGSTDALLEALRSAGFAGRLIRQANSGQGAATNRGIEACDTTHVSFLDHDDEWVPGRHAWQMAVLSQPDPDIVIGGVTNVVTEDGGIVREIDMGPARVLGAGLFPRDVFDRVGLLPEDARIHEIFDWWSRADGVVSVHMDPQPALRRHIHGGNMTLQPEHRDRADLIIRLREHLHRHGRSNGRPPG